MRVIHVLRKPLSESTTAANVLRHSTGAMNIDATRIAFTDNVNMDAQQRQQNSEGVIGGAFGAASLIGKAIPTYKPGGRWPANLVLQHLDGCVQEGVKKVGSGKFVPHDGVVRSSPMMSPEKGWNGNNLNNSKKNAPNQYGTETIPAWVCAEGCPVAGLDSQSGDRKAGGGKNATIRLDGDVYGHGNAVRSTVAYFDAGSASRFFKQVK